MTSGAVIDMAVKEGNLVSLNCVPRDMGTMVVWFRHLDTTGMEFIASFTNNGVLKSARNSVSELFGLSKDRPISLKLKSFNQTRDSGVYSCASLKGSDLIFGNVIRLFQGALSPAQEVPALLWQRLKRRVLQVERQQQRSHWTADSVGAHAEDFTVEAAVEETKSPAKASRAKSAEG
ncbi:hypothetical protein F7725_016749 [Dissostichus mawsoni]|uniref:Ig-like domain-containing protein n=1 Tax=Dissostichus mawsoni TaxID=36200 RepID=A0A7J5Z361_DISMA|nr:hypothetical protein F7725_016749 [Dissostichus mawsoni]